MGLSCRQTNQLWGPGGVDNSGRDSHLDWLAMLEKPTALLTFTEDADVDHHRMIAMMSL